MNVRLTKEQQVRVLNAEDLYKIMQQVLLRENKIRRNQEHFWVIGLNSKNKVLFVELISLGAVNRLMVNPPEVFRMAIYKLAVSVVLVHNHPSGSTDPSAADKDFTDRMIKTGLLINIDVVDHLIISENNYTSFLDAGLLEELNKSGLYELLDAEKISMMKMKEELEREQALREFGIEIARKMKEDGVDSETIKKYTGLTKREINGL